MPACCRALQPLSKVALARVLIGKFYEFAWPVGGPDPSPPTGLTLLRDCYTRRKAPAGGRPGLLPPCRRAGPTGECASLGDITMQPTYCNNSIQVAIYI